MSEQIRPVKEGINVSKIPELSLKETADIVFWSFYYSQGDAYLQKNIFRYIAAKHPNYQAHFKQLEIREMLSPRIKTFLEGRSHTQMTPDSVQSEIATITEDFYSIMNEDIKSDIDQNLGLIFRRIIDKDYRFTHNTDKYRTRNPDKNNGPFARNLSHFVEYVLLKKDPPGPHIYREMMAGLQSLLQDPHVLEPEPDLGTSARRLINDYNVNHPKEPIDSSVYPALASGE